MLRYSFIPDYTVRAVTEVFYLRIKRSHYLAAKKATLLERSKKVSNAGEHFDDEVEKVSQLLAHPLSTNDNIFALYRCPKTKLAPRVPTYWAKLFSSKKDITVFYITRKNWIESVFCITYKMNWKSDIPFLASFLNIWTTRFQVSKDPFKSFFSISVLEYREVYLLRIHYFLFTQWLDNFSPL